MPKDEWGVKRICPTTGKRFYDLNKNPIVSPYTGDRVELDTSRTRMIAADAADKSAATPETEEDQEEAVVLDDDDVDVDLGDDVLQEDGEDNVPLEDIADVTTDEDEG
jgi:uncharacterized protein (TIGR02300 family)